MNREIKFRGKIAGAYIGNDPQNKWFYGSLVKELSTGKTYILDVAHTDKGEARFNTLGLEVDPNTVGQFTGLLDKNGKEIYEGDKLSIIDAAKNKGVVTVGFEEGGFIVFKGLAWRNIGHYDVEKNEFEVIGNIHD